MKIYEVEFENIKWIGESNKIVTISASGIKQALNKANKVAENRQDMTVMKNWNRIFSWRKFF